MLLSAGNLKLNPTQKSCQNFFCLIGPQISEDKRKERLATRQDGHGKWEKLFETDPTFANRVKTAFRRQSRNSGNFCKLTPVDAKGAVDEVLEEAKQALASAGFSA